MSRKKQGCLIAFLIVLAVVVSYLVAVYFYDREMTDYGRQSNYLSNRGYAHALGLRNFNYDLVLQTLGVPVDKTVQKHPDLEDIMLISLEYPEFRLNYTELTEFDGSTSRSLYLVTVRGESIKFGRKQIGVGSSREDVHKAYEKEPMISQGELASSAEDFPSLSEGYYGEDWSRILFCYNDAGIVISMAYEPPSN